MTLVLEILVSLTMMEAPKIIFTQKHPSFDTKNRNPNPKIWTQKFWTRKFGPENFGPKNFERKI